MQFPHLTLLGAALAGMILDSIWFSPLIFGKLETKLSRLNAEQIQTVKQGAWRSYLFAFAGSFVKAYILFFLMILANIHTIGGGLQFGFLAWLGFESTVFLGGVLWDGKTLKWYFLHIGHHLLTILLMSAIIAWQIGSQ